MSDLFHIGLCGWIIQDGNYPDMRVWQTVRFALEFYSESAWRPLDRGQVRRQHVSGGLYAAAWRAALLRPSPTSRWQRRDIAVIDLGVLAYRELATQTPCTEGSWYEGQIHLGVDPFFYFESLAKLDWMPPLIYTWAIREIIRDTTPRILADCPSIPGINKKAWVRDPSRQSHVVVEATDAWNHEDAEYVLVCEKLPDEPTRTL